MEDTDERTADQGFFLGLQHVSLRSEGLELMLWGDFQSRIFEGDLAPVSGASMGPV